MWRLNVGCLLVATVLFYRRCSFSTCCADAGKFDCRCSFHMSCVPLHRIPVLSLVFFWFSLFVCCSQCCSSQQQQCNNARACVSDVRCLRRRTAVRRRRHCVRCAAVSVWLYLFWRIGAPFPILTYVWVKFIEVFIFGVCVFENCRHVAPRFSFSLNCCCFFDSFSCFVRVSVCLSLCM